MPSSSVPAFPVPSFPARPGVQITPDNQHEGRRAYQTLDGWRGIASVWVLLYHASLSLPALGIATSQSPLALAVQGGYLGVPLFFVISGYCIANAAVSAARRGQGARPFFAARVRRIYPPYLLVLLMTLLTLHFLHGLAWNSLQSPLFLTASLTLTQIPFRQPLLQPVFWTLNYEVAFYVLVGVPLLLPFLRSSPRALLNTLHGLTLLTTALMIVLPRVPWFPLDFWTQFGLGVLVFDCVRHPQEKFARAALALTVLGTIAFAATHDYGNMLVAGGPPLRIGLLVSAGFALLLFALYKFDARLEKQPVAQGLAWLGGFSYSLYLVHPLVIGAVLRGAHALSWQGRLPGLCFAVEICLSLLCARALFVCCERPFLAMGKPKGVPPEAALAPVKGSVE